MIHAAAKAVADAVALVLTFPCAVTCWIESRFGPHAETIFGFWTHVFALLPGPPGLALRRAFYRHTLEGCAASFFIGFGALFTHRKVTVEESVYVGVFALIGSAWLRKGALIGSRASLLSGPSLHEPDANGGWLPADLSRLQKIEVGEKAWIGEGAVVMANVGAGSMVAAGAVVSAPVPPGVVVGGNPARFVKRLAPPPAAPADGAREENANGVPLPSLH